MEIVARMADNSSAISRAPKAIATILRWSRGLARGILRSGRRRQIAELQLVERSQLFDPVWYLSAYPDVAATKVDPLRHYMSKGWLEGRDPGPEFATSAYLKANADVARAGINPLVHFIEFGHSEGRDIFGHSSCLNDRRPAVFDFARPAPCISLPVLANPPVAWLRLHRLNARRRDCLKIEGTVLGYVSSPQLKSSFQEAFSLLQSLSGFGQEISGSEVQNPHGSGEALADAWYVGSSQLRTRWRFEEYPCVVRAFQHDPVLEGAVCLVGEGLISSEIDIFDLHLKNPFFPVMFTFGKPEGVVNDWMLLPFPSLCRGGVHYPELLHATVSASATGPQTYGVEQSRRLLRVIGSEAGPAVTALEIRLDRADGTGPMFQHDFRLWLERVARVRVSADEASSDAFPQLDLVRAVAASPSRPRREGGATMKLGPDMIPTIASLSECRSEGKRGSGEVLVGLLAAGSEYTRRSVFIEQPREMTSLLHLFPGGRLADWPRLRMEQGSVFPDPFPPGAIRLPTPKRISEPELLVPLARLRGSVGAREPVTWLIQTKNWDEEELSDAIHTLALQDGAKSDAIALICPEERESRTIEHDAFPGHVRLFSSTIEAVRGIETPLAAYLGAGIFLHDDRTAELLSSLLQTDTVVTASCVLIRTEMRATEWHAAIADAGVFVTVSGCAPGTVEYAEVVEALWRSNHCVVEPPQDLWVARSPDIQAWMNDLGGLEPLQGVHIVTSLITASCSGRGEAPHDGPNVPRAPSDKVTRVETILG